MSSNPYASYLGGQDADVILAATAERLKALACGMTPEQLEAPWTNVAPGKWSPREILVHLADCELAFSFRLRQILAAGDGEDYLVQPFDQTVWSERYTAYDVPGALAVFTAVRGWNMRLLTTITAADRGRRGMHPERGPVTFQTVLETMAGHDVNHLRQLEAVAKG